MDDQEGADALGVDEATLSQWESGKAILYREHRKRVAAFLGINGTALPKTWRAWSEKHVRAGT